MWILEIRTDDSVHKQAGFPSTNLWLQMPPKKKEEFFLFGKDKYKGKESGEVLTETVLKTLAETLTSQEKIVFHLTPANVTAGIGLASLMEDTTLGADSSAVSTTAVSAGASSSGTALPLFLTRILADKTTSLSDAIEIELLLECNEFRQGFACGTLDLARLRGRLLPGHLADYPAEGRSALLDDLTKTVDTTHKSVFKNGVALLFGSSAVSSQPQADSYVLLVRANKTVRAFEFPLTAVGLRQ